MKAERQHKEATSRVIQPSKGGRGIIVDNRYQAVNQSKIIDCIQQKTNSSVVQRAVVSGIRNDRKNELEIGNDMHSLVQKEFLASDLPIIFNLYTEFDVGGGRADLVAINDERGDDGIGDCYIYVGEIKPESLYWTNKETAYTQLDGYINAFRQDPRFRYAYVGALDFWNPSSQGLPITGNGYDCTVFIRNRNQGLYTYLGKSKDESISKMEDELDDEDLKELPFNEQPDSYFL